MDKLTTCNYDFKLKNIGSGSYGEVSVVEKDGQKFAYKKIKVDKILKESFFYDPIELDIIFRLQSPYLIRGDEIMLAKQCTKELGLVTEYIDGNLGKDIDKMSFTQRKRIMYDIAQGLKCMHDNNYLHLDVKLDNTLYRKEEAPRGVLIDYGLSSYAPYGVEVGIYTNSPRYTAEFTSPEGLVDANDMYQYTNKNDIWALGITFCEAIADGQISYVDEEIISGYSSKNETEKEMAFKELSKLQMTLFADKNIDNTLEDYVFHYGPKSIEHKELLIDLLKKMLKVNKKLRCDINEVVNHPFFKEYQNNRNCFVKAPKLIESYIFEENHLKGVNEIVRICNDELSKESCYILFMAVDIYMRFLANIKNYSDIMDQIIESINNLPRICVLIANKYFYWSEFLNNEMITEIEGLIFSENLIYKIIDGRIRDERYFCECRNTSEVKFVYKHFIEPKRVSGKITYERNPNLHKFLSYNGKEFMESNRVEGKDTMTFNLTIDKL
jgi:serine/threonine protein kinase